MSENDLANAKNGEGGMSDTPRTDAFLISSDGQPDFPPSDEDVVAFCRQLERELAASESAKASIEHDCYNLTEKVIPAIKECTSREIAAEKSARAALERQLAERDAELANAHGVAQACELRAEKAEARLTEIADYIEPSWKGAGGDVTGEWILQSVVRLGRELEEAYERAEKAEAEFSKLKEHAEALYKRLEAASEATAYSSHEDSVGYRVCCDVASYKQHDPTCPIVAVMRHYRADFPEGKI